MKIGTATHLRSGALVPAKYNWLMKTWKNSLRFDQSQPAKFRLDVLRLWDKYGLKITRDLTGISTSTLYLWKNKLKQSGGQLHSLIPKSTRPKRVRFMATDHRLLGFIKSLREKYGDVGKETIQPLLEAYAHSLGIASYGATKIGKIIKRHHYFFEQTLKHKSKRKKRLVVRTRKCPKDITKPGYIQLDSITIYVNGAKKYFLTAIDVFTRVATAKLVPTLSAKHTVDFIRNWQEQLTYPITTIQTDNGSEFLGVFAQFVADSLITQVYNYPHTPTANGYVERFNYTIQRHFTDRCDELWTGENTRVNIKLAKFLFWYNSVRPHHSLGKIPPAVFTKQYFSNMYAT